MASERALAVRRATVVGRLNVAAATLADRYGLPVPAGFGRPAHSRVDPELVRVMDMEQVADLWDAFLASDAPKAVSAKAASKAGD